MSPKNSATYVLDVGGIPVQVTRKRVKNVNFRVDSQGKAHMSVPWNMARNEVERYALRHYDWFSKCIKERENNALPAPVAWEDGETVCVWGSEVFLCVHAATTREYCSWENNVFVMYVYPESTPEHRRDLFERWLADDMRMRLADLLPECEERVGAHATAITLRRMKTRWGSCTAATGRIRLNTALAECPSECLELVLVHELCHLHVQNHGPKFRALMDLYYPSWRVWQRWLDNHPSRP